MIRYAPAAVKRNVLKIVIILALTAVFVYFFVRNVKLGEVIRYVTDVNLPLFILSFPLAALHFFTRGFRWRYLLCHEKKDVRYSHMVAGNIIGFTVTFVFPGRLGELAKPLYLAQKEGMRKGFVVGTAVVERIFDMFTMCFLLGLFILARPLYARLFAIDAESYRRLSFWGFSASPSPPLFWSSCFSSISSRTRPSGSSPPSSGLSRSDCAPASSISPASSSTG